MLFSTGRILERNISGALGSWLEQERQTELDAIPNSIKRQTAKALFAFSQDHPNAAAATLSGIARLRGYSYLGAGIEFSTYLRRTDKTAVKIHRKSANMTRLEREALVEDKVLGHALLTQYLGNTALPQSVQIEEHVLGGGFQTVQIEQPYVAFCDDDAPFSLNAESIDINRLARLVQRVPGIDSALEEMIVRSRIMYDEKELLPDTNGTNNIVALPSANLALIDSTPIGCEHPGVQELIIHQLGSLERGLQEVA